MPHMATLMSAFIVEFLSSIVPDEQAGPRQQAKPELDDLIEERSECRRN